MLGDDVMTPRFPPLARAAALLPAAALLLSTPACAGQIIPPGDAPAAPADAPGEPEDPALPGALPGSAAPPYAEVADLVVASPLVIDATIRSATRIKGAEAASAAPGRTRFYVEADVMTLVRGAEAIPARVGWVVDAAPDARGRPPRLKKQRVLAFARAVAGRPGQVQLVAEGGMRGWTPALDALARRIAAEASAPDAPPVITGVGSAFHVPGALPGEGETQIFLTTATGRPAALSVLRRPGEEPRWSVTTSEVIDERATAPARDTLLWYRVACALPAALPEASVAALAEADAAVAREDYGYVVAELGPCRPGSGESRIGTDVSETGVSF